MMAETAMKHRILVVEDDAPSRKGLEDLLSAWGYEVTSASDGADALERLADESPAVVVSDLGKGARKRASGECREGERK